MLKETKECNPLDSIFIVINNKSQIENKELEKQVFNMLDSFRKRFKESKQQDQQNASKYETYIKILKKILKDASRKETKRILVMNPLDDGTSRKDFLHRIHTSPIIPKQNLKRIASKQGEEKVRYLQEKMLQETNPILNNIVSLQNKINKKSKNEETEKLLSQYDDTINNQKDKISKLENKQSDNHTDIKRLKNKIQDKNEELDKLTLQIEKETKQIQELNNEKNTFLQHVTQDSIISLAKQNKNWFDHYQQWLNPISDHWAKTKLQPSVFDPLKKNIYNQLKACNPSYLTLQSHIHNVRSVDFNHNGSLLASASYNTIRIWDTNTWQCKNTLQGYTNLVNSVHFNHNGSLLASASEDNTIRIWNTNTWQCKNTLQGHTSDVNSVHFNHNGSLLASASWDKTIRIWDTNTWKCKKTLQGHTSWVDSVHFNHNGSLLASASYDYTIRIWDTNTWQCKNTLQGHTSTVDLVHFNHNGSLLASASWDETIRIWDTNTWQCKNTLQGHTNWVFSIHFNHNGSLLASASEDKTIRIWDTNTWQCKKTLQGHTSDVNSVHFNHNGSLLVSASWDKTIRIWDTKNMLDNTQSNYSLLDTDKFKLQTDPHLKKIKEILNHYYKDTIQALENSDAQKKKKRIQNNITSLQHKIDQQQKEKLNLQKQIDEINKKIDSLKTTKLKKIEDLIKKKENKDQFKYYTQEKEQLDNTFHNLQQVHTQQTEKLNDISIQLFHAGNEHEYLLKELRIIKGNHEDVSRDLKTDQNDLVAYQDMLERKQEGIDLILKIDKIVPMGLIAYSFIKKYMQCKVNNKHM